MPMLKTTPSPFLYLLGFAKSAGASWSGAGPALAYGREATGIGF